MTCREVWFLFPLLHYKQSTTWGRLFTPQSEGRGGGGGGGGFLRDGDDQPLVSSDPYL